jgi:hypothetical protein
MTTNHHELLAPTATAISAVRDAMAPWVSGRLLPNFSSGEPAAQLHPTDVLARLAAIKDERDPRRVIRSNHPVSGATADRSDPVGASR